MSDSLGSRPQVRNSALSVMFCEPLQGLGIVLRNAICGRFNEPCDDAWHHTDRAGLDRDARERIMNARTVLARDGQGKTPSGRGCVVVGVPVLEAGL